jgi:hypothetical protein
MLLSFQTALSKWTVDSFHFVCISSSLNLKCSYSDIIVVMKKFYVYFCLFIITVSYLH